MSKAIKIVWVPITAVSKNPSNPRTISERKMAELMDSITGFPKMMEYRPVVADRKTGHIIGGNQRHEACTRLGWKEIPVAYIEDIDPRKMREFILKDNLQFGEWDFTKLKEFYTQSDLLSWGLEDAKYVSFFNPEDEETAAAEPGAPAGDRAEPQDHYDENVIKKIVFNLSTAEYDAAVGTLSEFNKRHGFEDNSQALLRMLELHKKDEAGV